MTHLWLRPLSPLEPVPKLVKGCASITGVEWYTKSSLQILCLYLKTFHYFFPQEKLNTIFPITLIKHSFSQYVNISIVAKSRQLSLLEGI